MTHTHLTLRFLCILGPRCIVAILLSLKKHASSKIISHKSDSLYSPPRDPSGNLPGNGESSSSSICKLLSVAHQVALLVDSETIQQIHRVTRPSVGNSLNSTRYHSGLFSIDVNSREILFLSIRVNTSPLRDFPLFLTIKLCNQVVTQSMENLYFHAQSNFKNTWRPGLALGVTQRQPASKLIT